LTLGVLMLTLSLTALLWLTCSLPCTLADVAADRARLRIHMGRAQHGTSMVRPRARLESPPPHRRYVDADAIFWLLIVALYPHSDHYHRCMAFASLLGIVLISGLSLRGTNEKVDLQLHNKADETTRPLLFYQ
jgi:hypothetical protein